MWSMQQCVLVSPGGSVLSPHFQCLIIVEMRISHILFLFGGCFCSPFIEFWGHVQLVQERINRREARRGERQSQCKSCVIFFSEQLCASGI